VSAKACIVCDADEWDLLHEVLVRCARCGFTRAASLPSPSDATGLYGAEYFEGGEYADYLGDEPAHMANFRRRFERITAISGGIESLFEIGCAYGFWLRTAVSRGVRSAGIDISPQAVHHAAETLHVDARLGRFEDSAIRPGEFQAMCMWDTIEHLPHPEVHVARIVDLLPAGGWFFLTTGDIGSPLAQREGPRWRMIHPPTHLQYFSRGTLTRFLARHGLQAAHIESAAMCRSVHGTIEGLKRFGAGPSRAVAVVASRIVPSWLGRRIRYTLDLGDIMLVCGRKTASVGHAIH
jgi:SAM-dependent methyltransferase